MDTHVQHSQDSHLATIVAVLTWILRKLLYSQCRYLTHTLLPCTCYTLIQLVVKENHSQHWHAITTQPELQLSHRQQVPHSKGSYHTVSGSTTGLHEDKIKTARACKLATPYVYAKW